MQKKKGRFYPSSDVVNSTQEHDEVPEGLPVEPDELLEKAATPFGKELFPEDGRGSTPPRKIKKSTVVISSDEPGGVSEHSLRGGNRYS